MNFSWHEAGLVMTLANAYFFHRFHRRTGERIFGMLAAAFVVLGIERGLLVIGEDWTTEDRWPVYLLRLGAFLLIAWGIAEKNLSARIRRRDLA